MSGVYQYASMWLALTLTCYHVSLLLLEASEQALSMHVVNNNATLSNFNYPWILEIVFFDTTGSFSLTTGVRTLYLYMIAVTTLSRQYTLGTIS